VRVCACRLYAPVVCFVCGCVGALCLRGCVVCVSASVCMCAVCTYTGTRATHTDKHNAPTHKPHTRTHAAHTHTHATLTSTHAHDAHTRTTHIPCTRTLCACVSVSLLIVCMRVCAWVVCLCVCLRCVCVCACLSSVLGVRVSVRWVCV